VTAEREPSKCDSSAGAHSGTAQNASIIRRPVRKFTERPTIGDPSRNKPAMRRSALSRGFLRSSLNLAAHVDEAGYAK